MIKDWKHANAVQMRRNQSGKKGVAKAVRRWLRKQGDMVEIYKRELS